MKLFIFLDVDGTLNHEPKTKDCGKAQHNYGTFKILCSRCVGRLNSLVRELHTHYDDFEFILSSTWRRIVSLKEMNALLGMAGFQFEVTAVTSIQWKPRGEQIQDYLVGEEYYRYIVLDDDTLDMNLVKDNQVVTNYKSGFDNAALDRAIHLMLEIR